MFTSSQCLLFRSGTMLCVLALLVSVACGEPDSKTDAAAKKSSTTPSASAPQKTVRIVLAGDSTVTDAAGWGVGFSKQLASHVECMNQAKGGTSSKSYIDSGRWKECRKLRPAYVLIQFGHNDQPGKGADRETDPQTTYRQNLIKFVDEARAASIRPILVTPLSHRSWNKEGKIESSLAPYAEVVKQVAAEKGTLCIDLHARSIDLYEKLGREGCLAISPEKKTGTEKKAGTDNTHLNAKGSEMIGALIVAELASMDRSVASLFQATPAGNSSAKPIAADPGAKTVKVAAISFVPIKFDLPKNTEKLERAFRKAKQGGAQVAVAPEGSLEGYVVEQVISGHQPAEKMRQVAIGIDDPVIQRFEKLAKELDMCLVFGFAEKIGDDIFNAALFIDNQGKIRGKHHKLQFSSGYHPSWWFNRLGAQCRAFDTPFGRCGLIICNERWNPDIAEILAADGAQFLLISSFGSRKPTQDETVLNRGRENNLPVVEANVGVTLVVDQGRITSFDRNEEQITFGSITVAPARQVQPDKVDKLEQKFIKGRDEAMQRQYEERQKRRK
ncbi:MAG: nitrilase-related carbon-nitrogen hydrolase [Planctomycetota bacterium]|nr:nitrilase-related carbon-nitrogen hydrolase [Planctomycetota bacterium]